MINRLFIRNYALIEKAEIELNNGFTVITGETGAGKSILLGAIGLTLGERADFSALKNKDSKCIIEAEFNIEDFSLNSFFEENDLDFEKNTLIRREISPSGKSRAFINDTPVTLSILKEFTSKLINIHSQNQTHQLKSEEYITQLLDSYSNNPKILDEYKDKLQALKAKKNELNRLLEESQKLKSEADYNRFQYDEIKALNLENVNFDELKDEVELNENKEQIASTLQNALNLMDEEELGVLSRLRLIKNQITQLSSVSSIFSDLNDRIESGLIELNDIHDEISNHLEISSSSNSSEVKVEVFNEINRLLQKHFYTDIDQLRNLEVELSKKLDFADHSEELTENLKKEIETIESRLKSLAEEIHLERCQTATNLEAELKNLLSELVLPHAETKFVVKKQDQFRPNGMDQIQFLFNANPGGELVEISKSASGGETSRLMLAIQYLLSTRKSLATLIFDEIDTGISGEIASKIGDLLRKISKNMQVISITHLPQMASKGDNHLKVYKENTENQTKTYIQKLSKEERIREIAKMLSGEEISEASIENAKALLTF